MSLSEPSEVTEQRRSVRIRRSAVKLESPPKRVRRSVSPSVLDGPFAYCVARCSENCTITVENGSRLSKTEYCCRMCMKNVFSDENCNAKFQKWKNTIKEELECGAYERLIKPFLYSQLIPYWVCCKICEKWQEYHSLETLDAAFLLDFRCPNDCRETEESDIVNILCRDDRWFKSFPTYGLLKRNVASNLISREYVFAKLGLDPADIEGGELVEFGEKHLKSDWETTCEKLFYEPGKEVVAHSLDPSQMDLDESLEFGEFYNSKYMSYYLAVRNTIVSMWALNPFMQITIFNVTPQIIVRGHARIFFCECLVPRVIAFLQRKGIINYGLLPLRTTLKAPIYRQKVAIIGAGMSGLSAARHLIRNGVDVTVFEAKSRVGGRIRDNQVLRGPVGYGAQIIVGKYNNPIALMCDQGNIRYTHLRPYCPLIDAADGTVITKDFPEVDRMAEMHYNFVVNYRKSSEGKYDDVFEKMFNERSSCLLKMNPIKPEQAERFERLLHFHLGNYEFACGARARYISAFQGNTNEQFPNFAGPHCLVADGAQAIIEKMREEVHVEFQKRVMKIKWGDKGQKLYFQDNDVQRFDKVIVTSSLWTLKTKKIAFQPSLPQYKQTAIDGLGAGLIEKIAVRFENPFWEVLEKGKGRIDYFGHVPAEGEKTRLLFNIFYNLSNENHHVLMSYMVGEATDILNNPNGELEAVLDFCNTLRQLFPRCDVIPSAYMISRWGDDKDIGMSYSYVPANSFGRYYDDMAKPIGGKKNCVYFAGEATCHSEPQTMTGAFVSGIREGSRILQELQYS